MANAVSSAIVHPKSLEDSAERSLDPSALIEVMDEAAHERDQDDDNRVQGGLGAHD